jgi:uncharacterized protein (DUF427 family)
MTQTTIEQPTFVRPPAQVEPSARWVRVKVGGETIADSRRTLLVLQYPPAGLPTYYFPPADVRMEALGAAGSGAASGGLAYRTVTAGGQTLEQGAWIYDSPPEALGAVKGYVSFHWDRDTAWYEEDEQVFVHARDPHKRVDVLASTRHIRVMLAGEVVANSKRPTLLFETSLPTRYYLPREDVRMELLEPTESKTRCPYKGKAVYWSVRVGDQVWQDAVWSYPDPIAACAKIKDLLCFYNERVDTYVDGELEARPKTPWGG